MAVIRVGLAKKSLAVSDADVRKVAAALDVQVKRDLKLVWDIDADVFVVADPVHVPSGVWPIFIVDQTPMNFAGLHTLAKDGVHHDSPGTPWAIVSTKRDWQLAASHECIEMLVDPYGNTTVASRAVALDGDGVKDLDTNVDYLLEACDPIEDDDHAYEIDGVLVSDFYTPSYFDPDYIAGRRYSFNEAITRPREVRPGGYLSWRTPAGQLQQLRNFGGFTLVDLPEHDPSISSLRAHVDRNTITPRLEIG